MLSPEQEAAMLDKLQKLKVSGPGTGHIRLKNIIVIHEIKQGISKSLLGLDELQALPSEQVLGSIAAITGCSAMLAAAEGEGYIDPRATLKGIVSAALLIVEVCKKRGNIILGTGHPGSMIGFYLELAKTIRNLGGNLISSGKGYSLTTYQCKGCQLHDITEEIDYIGDVAVVTNGELLLHTHDYKPMKEMLSAAKENNSEVDLVIADHGFAGFAIKNHIPTIAIMDTNDPAIAASTLLGYRPIIIPMDDNRPNSISAQVAQIITTVIHIVCEL